MAASITITFGNSTPVKGRLEGVEGRFVRGWARPPEGLTLDLIIAIDNRIIFSGPLKSSSSGEAKCNFAVEIPLGCLDGDEHWISARIKETSQELDNSPLVSPLSAIRSATWQLDEWCIVGSLKMTIGGEAQIDVIAGNRVVSTFPVAVSCNQASDFRH